MFGAHVRYICIWRQVMCHYDDHVFETACPLVYCIELSVLPRRHVEVNEREQRIFRAPRVHADRYTNYLFVSTFATLHAVYLELVDESSICLLINRVNLPGAMPAAVEQR